MKEHYAECAICKVHQIFLKINSALNKDTHAIPLHIIKDTNNIRRMEISYDQVMLTYVDDIVVIIETN
jgi:hypothetical protein